MTLSVSKIFADDAGKAWMGSFLFHLLLVLVLYLINVDESRGIAGYVEVTLGSFGTVAPAQSPQVVTDDLPEAFAKSSASVVMKRSKAMQPDLPERKYPTNDEILRVPEPKKLDVADQSETKTVVGREQRLLGEKEFGAGKSLESEKLTGEGERGITGDGAGFSGSSVGTDIGRSIGYSIQWVGGATRQKISGELPTYPEGANVEAQIRLQAVVAPDGTVKSLQPIQKAHVRLEEASMKEVRFWKFEPLSSTHPQVDQTCTITFNFKLK